MGRYLQGNGDGHQLVVFKNERLDMRLEITLQGMCECGRPLEEVEEAFESGEVTDIIIFQPCPCEKEKLEKRVEALMVWHNLLK